MEVSVFLDALTDTLGVWWRIVWRVALAVSVILSIFVPGSYPSLYELLDVPVIVPPATLEDITVGLFIVALGAGYLSLRLTTCQHCGDVSSASGECPECGDLRGEVPPVIDGEVIQHIPPEEQGEFEIHPHFRNATEGQHILVVKRDDVEESLAERILSRIPIPFIGSSHPHVVDVAAEDPIPEGDRVTVRGDPVTIDVDGTKDATEVQHGER